VALVALVVAPTLQGEEQLDYGTDHIPTQEELRQQQQQQQRQQQQQQQQQGIPGKGSGQQGGVQKRRQQGAPRGRGGAVKRGKGEHRHLGGMPARSDNGWDLRDPGHRWRARVRERYPDGSDCQSDWHQQPLGMRRHTNYNCFKQQWRREEDERQAQLRISARPAQPWLMGEGDPSTGWLGLNGNHLYANGPVTVNHFHAPVHFARADMLFARAQP